MAEPDNVRILKAAYALWNGSKAKSVEHWLDLVTDDVTWKSLANGAVGMEFTADCNCKYDVQRYFENLGRDWEMVHYTVDEYIAQGDRVVALARCHWRHRHTGLHVETPKADIIRMRNSKIVEFFEFYDTAKALAAASGKKL